jgi:hypothetical protein
VGNGDVWPPLRREVLMSSPISPVDSDAAILSRLIEHEAESYERLGHLVALLRSKARKSLKTASSGS